MLVTVLSLTCLSLLAIILLLVQVMRESAADEARTYQALERAGAVLSAAPPLNLVSYTHREVVEQRYALNEARRVLRDELDRLNATP